VRKAVSIHVAPEALAQRRGLFPGNEVVTTLRHVKRVEELTPRKAATRRMALREAPAAA